MSSGEGRNRVNDGEGGGIAEFEGSRPQRLHHVSRQVAAVFLGLVLVHHRAVHVAIARQCTDSSAQCTDSCSERAEPRPGWLHAGSRISALAGSIEPEAASMDLKIEPAPEPAPEPFGNLTIPSKAAPAGSCPLAANLCFFFCGAGRLWATSRARAGGRCRPSACTPERMRAGRPPRGANRARGAVTTTPRPSRACPRRVSTSKTCQASKPAIEVGVLTMALPVPM